MKAQAPVAIAAYIAAIVAANVLTNIFGLVSTGFGLLVTAGTFAAGFALLARDFVQKHAGIPWVFAGIAIGGLLSWVLSTPGLALASVVAFTVAELVDLAVYTPLAKRGFVRAALASNVVAAPVDTIIFLSIAGFPLTVPVIAGQLVGKLLWATIIPLALYVLGRRVANRKAITA